MTLDKKNELTLPLREHRENICDINSISASLLNIID